MRILLIIAGILLVAATALTGYEGGRVLQARAKTPALMREALLGLDPQITLMPKARVDALIKIEDPTFWTNDGIDLTTPGAGQTTLSQGLAKRLYFSRFKPGFKKLELILITKFALTRLASKPDILHAALARAYLGQDQKGAIIGFPEAAKRYYRRELSELSDDEYLSLVAMLIAPNALDPLRHPEANAERVARMKRLISGECRPNSVNDVALVGCAVLVGENRTGGHKAALSVTALQYPGRMFDRIVLATSLAS